MRRPGVAVLVVLALSAASCSSSSDDDPPDPDATLGTAPRSTEAPDPYAIPDDPADIDEAYVQRVVDALYEVDGEASRALLDAGVVTDQATEILASIYDGPTLDDEVAGWEQLLADPSRLAAARAGDAHLSNDVVAVRSSSPECIFIEAERDYTEAVSPAPPNRTVWIGLAPIDPREDPFDHNPTPWIVFQDGVQVDPGAPVENPCDA